MEVGCTCIKSLSYTANGKNAFADPGDAHGLSKIAKQFIAGQLAHARRHVRQYWLLW